MLLVIDNYDSFTYNLVHYVQELGAPTCVIRNDEGTAAEALSANIQAVLISPGPKDPNASGFCLELLQTAPEALPIFGVCLGMQAIAQAYGGEIIPAKQIMHGKTSPIHHDASGLLTDFPNPFISTRYHSLAVNANNLPSCLHVNGWTVDGEVMSLHHKTRPIYGVQFHPESIASSHGHALLHAFLQKAGFQTHLAPEHANFSNSPPITANAITNAKRL